MTINKQATARRPAGPHRFPGNAPPSRTPPRLQCWIPADLHQWLKFKAVDGHTNMTALVVEALQKLPP